MSGSSLKRLRECHDIFNGMPRPLLEAIHAVSVEMHAKLKEKFGEFLETGAGAEYKVIANDLFISTSLVLCANVLTQICRSNDLHLCLCAEDVHNHAHFIDNLRNGAEGEATVDVKAKIDEAIEKAIKEGASSAKVDLGGGNSATVNVTRIDVAKPDETLN